MKKSINILSLILSELGIASDISGIENRVAIQKAIYLAQCVFGSTDLGYRYGWYIHGPYCPALADDYYSLEEVGDKRVLTDWAKSRLNVVKKLIGDQPDNFTQNVSGWLELLASYHFLRKVSHYSREDAFEVLQNKKPHLIQWVTQCEQSLINAALL